MKLVYIKKSGNEKKTVTLFSIAAFYFCFPQQNVCLGASWFLGRRFHILVSYKVSGENQPRKSLQQSIKCHKLVAQLINFNLGVGDHTQKHAGTTPGSDSWLLRNYSWRTLGTVWDAGVFSLGRPCTRHIPYVLCCSCYSPYVMKF